MSISYVVKSVSWNDLELLKPLDVIIFKDPESIELITEFAEENKDWIKATCTKVGLYDYAVYFKEIKQDSKPWHKPSPLSPIFIAEKLLHIEKSDVVSLGELKDRVRDSFVASMPEKLSPIYEHTLD